MIVGQATSRGYTISFEDAGDGPVVVLVNGTASPAAEWRERGYVDRLTDRFRVLSVDCLGNGQSDTPHDWEAYRPPDIAADVVAAMDAAGVERAALWGYSRGGWLVTMVATEFPERVASLVVGGWADAAGPRDPNDEVAPTVEALMRGDWPGFWAALGMPVTDADRTYMEQSSDPRAVGAMSLADRRCPWLMDLDRVSAPTLLYCADDDAADPTWVAQWRSTADRLGVQPHVLSGEHDHFSAFNDVAAVMPLVGAHLDATLGQLG
jgi:pimeloyl-ACP methyl ester carboxylesterase